TRSWCSTTARSSSAAPPTTSSCIRRTSTRARCATPRPIPTASSPAPKEASDEVLRPTHRVLSLHRLGSHHAQLLPSAHAEGRSRHRLYQQEPGAHQPRSDRRATRAVRPRYGSEPVAAVHRILEAAVPG